MRRFRDRTKRVDRSNQKPANILIGLSELFTTATRQTSEFGAQTAGRAAQPKITTVELSGSINTVEASCTARGRRTVTRLADFGAYVVNSEAHATTGELRYEGFDFVRCSRHTSQTRALYSNGEALQSDTFAACGCNTFIPIRRGNERFVTTSSGCVTLIPTICSGTSIYPLTSALAPPTPTISGAEFLNELIEGHDGRRSWSEELTIENAEPVSTSASRISTPSITASENNCGSPVPADDTTLLDFVFDSASFAGCWQLRDGQFQLS